MKEELTELVKKFIIDLINNDLIIKEEDYKKFQSENIITSKNAKFLGIMSKNEISLYYSKQKIIKKIETIKEKEYKCFSSKLTGKKYRELVNLNNEKESLLELLKVVDIILNSLFRIRFENKDDFYKFEYGIQNEKYLIFGKFKTISEIEEEIILEDRGSL